MSEEPRVILVVEDETPLRCALEIKLQSEGFKVLTAKNGKQGLELAKSQKPDLILLDIMMPVMDGYTMAERLREDAWGKNADIIVLTNQGDFSSINTSLKNNVFEHIIKSDRKLEDIVKDIKDRLRGLNLKESNI